MTELGSLGKLSSNSCLGVRGQDPPSILPSLSVMWRVKITSVLQKTTSPEVGGQGIRNQKFSVKIQKSSCRANFPSHLATPFDVIVC